MRVTTKGARAFFLWTLCAFVVMMLVIGYQMAHAFNLSPFTYQMRERGVSANYAYISGDTLYMNNMAVALAAVLKAVAVQTDTVRGASSIVGIVDDTLIVDTDSTGSDVTIRFGRWGAGLRWHRATDALQFSNDFSTWTAIGSGSGSSTTNADSLGHVVFKPRVKTDGYVVKYDSDGDSLYLSADATGAAGDSNAITYETDRVAQYSDTGLYLGDIGDSTMLWYDLTADNIKAYVILYYVDDISDSALMSKYWIEATIGDSLTANGFLTGLNSTNGISGGASQNIVNIQLDPTFFAVGGDTVRIQNLNAGKLSFNVFGSPTDYDELVITENTLTTRTIGSWRVVYTNGSYALAGATVGAANTVLVGNGTSSAPSFRALTDADIPDNITITETGDISNVGVTAPITGGGSSGSVTIAFDWTWLYGFVDTTTASIPVATLANSVLYSWLYTTIDTSSATVLSVAMGNGGTGGGSNGALTLNVVGSDEIAVTADSIYVADSKIKSVHLEDGTIALADMGSNSVDSTKIVDASIGSGDIGTGRITTTHLLDGTVALADHAANSVDSTKIVDASIGSGDIGTGRITTTHILDGTIALADHASNSVDSTKIVDASIGSGDIGTGRITTTHILDATIAKADLGTDLNRKIVPLKYIASQDHALEDNIILSLEGFDKADSTFYMFRDSSAAAGSDTIMLGCTLPSNITQADTLILIYKSSSGTTSTSKIDEVMLWVTSGQGVTLRTRDFSDATDKASSSRAKITYSLSTDGDFNEEEQVTLRIITAYGSASQFVKLYQAYLICR